jgi:hypothetical protein
VSTRTRDGHELVLLFAAPEGRAYWLVKFEGAAAPVPGTVYLTGRTSPISALRALRRVYLLMRETRPPWRAALLAVRLAWALVRWPRR